MSFFTKKLEKTVESRKKGYKDMIVKEDELI